MDGLACFVIGLGLLIYLLGGAAVVRTAVAIANRLLGPPRTKPRADPDDGEWDEWDEWDAEAEKSKPNRKPAKAVPEPGIAKSMMIASTVAMANVLVGYVLAVFAGVTGIKDELDDGPAVVLLVLFTAPFALVASALLLTAMLPAPFWRAALVAFLQYALVVVLALVIGGGVVLVWQLAAP